MRVMSGVWQMLQNPVEAYHKAVSQWRERHDRDDCPYEYIPDENWRQRLGISSDDREHTDRLCCSIEAILTAKGIRPGPESYLFWNDGDPAFLQAIWRAHPAAKCRQGCGNRRCAWRDQPDHP